MSHRCPPGGYVALYVRYHATVSRTPSSSGTFGANPVSVRRRVRSGQRRGTDPAGAGPRNRRGRKSAARRTRAARSSIRVSSVSLPTLTTEPHAAGVATSRVTASTASATWQNARRCSAPYTRNGSSRAHARPIHVVEAPDHRAQSAGARGVDHRGLAEELARRVGEARRGDVGDRERHILRRRHRHAARETAARAGLAGGGEEEHFP